MAFCANALARLALWISVRRQHCVAATFPSSAFVVCFRCASCQILVVVSSVCILGRRGSWGCVETDYKVYEPVQFCVSLFACFTHALKQKTRTHVYCCRFVCVCVHARTGMHMFIPQVLLLLRPLLLRQPPEDCRCPRSPHPPEPQVLGMSSDLLQSLRNALGLCLLLLACFINSLN